MRLKKFVAAGLAAVLALSMAGCAPAVESCPAAEKETTPETSALAAPVYPEMAQYPDEAAYWKKDGSFDDDGFSKVYDAWWADKRARNNLQLPDPDGMQRFLRASTGTMLAQGGGQNLVYSPLNVYMALSMLCECTDGNSRAQILTLLGQSDLASVRAQARALWNANYCADGAVTSILASSLWLNDGTAYVKKTLDMLAQNYYASAFSGKMGSDAYNKALQDWLNEQTGGLLKEQASGLRFDPETVLALATTIYYRAKWSNEFSKSRTSEGMFHAPSGDLTCDFMHSSGTGTYYWGERFGAVNLSLRESGCMKLLLPDEGVSPEELLKDAEAMNFLLGSEAWENSKFLIVNLSVPKFDVSSDLDLNSSLQALGVRDVFEADTADFSPVIEHADGVFLSKAKHAARVAIDEEGVTAAAYTVMMEAGAAMPPDEEIDFTLDRPFVFAITARSGLPLFVGIVNTPE